MTRLFARVVVIAVQETDELLAELCDDAPMGLVWSTPLI